MATMFFTEIFCLVAFIFVSIYIKDQINLFVEMIQLLNSLVALTVIALILKIIYN